MRRKKESGNMATTVWFLSGVLLCFLLGRGTQAFTQDGPRTQHIVQELLPKQSGPYESVFTHARANFTQVEPPTGDQDSYLNNEEDGPPKERVTLPPLNCVSDLDCKDYEDPFLLCRGGQCTCRPPYCWVYYYEVISAWSARNVFTCGTCGVLGSWCNATLECDFPGDCWSDGYCHCPQGENENGVCLTTNASWTYKLALLGMGVVALFAVILVSYNCYKEQPWRNPNSCWCCCCTKTGKRQRRRGSCEKTPAFTVQSHYASQDFTQYSSTEESFANQEPSVTGAVPRRSSPSRVSEISDEDEANTSITSVATTATIISNNSAVVHDSPSPSTSSTLAGIASFPAPSTTGSPHNNSAITSVTTTNQNVTRIVPEEVTATLQAVPEANTSTHGGGVDSPAGSQNCNHERCNLCLPRGPTTRPGSRGESRTSTPTHTRSTSFFSRGQDHEDDIIEFTAL